MRVDSMLGSFVLVLGVGVGLDGCVLPKPVGDGPTTEDGSSDGGSTATAGPTDATTEGETGAPLECFGLPDEPSCLAAGCTEFHTVLQVSDTCACTFDVSACILFPSGGGGGATSPDFFWHEVTGTVVMFDTSWAELPVGWRRCTDADAPPACDCYEPFMGPDCP